MLPPGWMIEEEQRRRDEERERRWAPIPIHAPSPAAPTEDPNHPDRRDEHASNGGTVIVIDMNSGSVTRI